MDGKVYGEKDRQVIDGITCPVCHAKPGEPCFYTNRWKQHQETQRPHHARATAYSWGIVIPAKDGGSHEDDEGNESQQ